MAGVKGIGGLSVNDGVVIFGAGSYADDGVTVQSNADNFTFSLGSAFDGKAFYGMSIADTISNAAENVSIYGSLGADSIYNEGANAYIDGGAGNDTVMLNNGAGATVNVGSGSDLISIDSNNINSFAVEGFSAGDTIKGFTADSAITSIDGGIAVGATSIYGVGAAIVDATAWSVGAGAAIYHLTNEPGATLQGGALVYSTVSGDTKDLLELGGVSSVVSKSGNNLVVDTATVAGITEGVLNIYNDSLFGSTGAISVNANGGSLAFNIGEGVTKSFYGADNADTITTNGKGSVFGGAG